MMEYQDIEKSFLENFPDFDGHERVRRIYDPESGLKAFIAVHNSNLGPGLGGCRMRKYESDHDAIYDVLRLSRGMTYKNALAGLPLGGGKSVIIGDPYTDKNDALMEAMGKAVESMKGLYITAEDSGTDEHDMTVMGRHTSYVTGRPGENGNLGGDPSPYTAYGVYYGMKAAVQRRYGTSNLAGKKVAVQGLGSVGYELCRLLHNDGVQLIVTDIRESVTKKAGEEFGNIQIVNARDIFSVEADIFAPCALGGQINDDTMSRLNVDIICGAANNQLAKEKHGIELANFNILYVPDYVVNAGGVIAVGYEYFKKEGVDSFEHDLTHETMKAHVERIGNTVTQVLNSAESSTPAQAADELAESLFKPEPLV